MKKPIRSELIPAERRALVLEHVQQRGAASIHELARAISVSASTVRRDLELLQDEGYLQRAHGGALMPRTLPSTFEPRQDFAAGLARSQKQAIGLLAASLVSPGEAIIFDSSSTVREAARALVARRIAVTAVTNDLATGQLLASAPEIRVIVPGGALRPGSLTLLGEPGLGFLGGVHADTALIGAHALTGRLVTETALDVTAVKRAMIAAARRVVLLVDSSKFQPAAFCTVCDASALHDIITDSHADKSALEELRQLGVTLHLASVPT